MRLGATLALLLAVAGCTGGSRDERGDAAWAAGDWTAALAFYRADAEARGGDAWAKVGAAALRARDWPAAAAAWGRLADERPARRAVALEGVLHAAEGAAAEGDAVGLGAAMAAFAARAPGVAVARLAGRLVELGGAPVDLLPAALAGAADPAAADRALAALAEAAEGEGGCRAALPLWTALERRGGTREERDRAAGAAAACALSLGEAALARDPAAAEGWFRQLLRVRPAGDTARRALLGLGDARQRQGDLLGAALAWQQVAAAADDSLSARAAERLNALASAGSTATDEE
ncbi:MAG TPA: hypothetical protein VLA95_08995 [Gemmatimonadales bacterium]|nr:hypothetical protein [Gemmatimonadales bacterium]